MSAILLHHGVKTTTPFTDALVQERLAEFLPCHAKNRVVLSSISEVRNYITEWPRFLVHPVELGDGAYSILCALNG